MSAVLTLHPAAMVEPKTLDDHLRLGFPEFPGHVHALNKRARRKWRHNHLCIPLVGNWANPSLMLFQQDVIVELLSHLQHHVLGMPYIWLVDEPLPTARFQQVSFTSPTPVHWLVECHNLEPSLTRNRHIRLVRVAH